MSAYAAPIVLDETTANRARVRTLSAKRDRAVSALTPYLTRDCGAGYSAEVYWPRADAAHVLIIRDGRTVDTLSCAPADALARFYHPAVYSARYAAELRERDRAPIGAAEPCEVGA